MSTSPTQDPATLAWTYPPAWTEDQRVAWEHATGELVAATKLLETTVAGCAAALATPEALLAETRARVLEAKRGADRLRRATAGQLAWVQAAVTHGLDVARLDSTEGDVIIQLYMTDTEVDHANERANRLLLAARKSASPDADEKARSAAELRGRHEHEQAHLDEVLKKCTVGGLDPSASAERLRYLTGRYASLAIRLVSIRDELVMGYRVREAKDSAP